MERNDGWCLLSKDESFRRTIIKFISVNSLDLSSVANLVGVDTKTIAKWMSGELVPHACIRRPIEQILLEATNHSANNSDT